MNTSNIDKTEPLERGTLITSRDDGVFIVVDPDRDGYVAVVYASGGKHLYTSAYVAQRLDRGEWSVSNADK